MKKILFITTRNPYSGRLSGDVIGSLKIINFLKKKHQIDVITLGRGKSNLKRGGKIFNHPNFFFKFFYVFFSLLRLSPMHFGIFFSKKMKTYIEQNAKNTIYCSSIILDLVNIYQETTWVKLLLKWEIYIPIIIIKLFVI